jgi:hypothetical protein
MQEYEAAAYLSIQKMRDKHDIEMLDLRSNMLNSYHSFTLSMKCCDLRMMEKKHFTVKEYIKANRLRQMADELEIVEIQMH